MSLPQSKLAPGLSTLNSQLRSCPSALSSQLSGRYAEAEKTLIQAHRGLVARESSIWGPQKASHIGLAAKYLVKLYEDWGRPDEADHWRRELEAVTAKYQPQTATAKRF